MIILGLDPGSTRVGYGFIRKEGQQLSFLNAGLLSITSTDPHRRLVELEASLFTLLRATTPHVVAIEKLFFMRNMKTAVAVSQSRGVLLLTLAKQKLPVLEYSPLEIKQGITGYGMASKKSVATVVAKILRIPPLHVHDDVTDALAAAILASMRSRMNTQE